MDEKSSMAVGGLKVIPKAVRSDAAIADPIAEPMVFRSRSYQLEMLDVSMRQNVIVAMDTGSGKTHIAILRIMGELDRTPRDKLIWFLVPTVSLCIQQHGVITQWLPAVKTRMLIGADNVDRWGERRIWDAVLEGVRIVVSTHAVLHDALSHGFVTMGQTSLLIFDEAHHCAGRHPANQIMQKFYHPLVERDGIQAVPHILGLTASPVVRSKPKALETIEQNLNSVCKTPLRHRGELLEHVHPPLLKRIIYATQPSVDDSSTGRSALRALLSIKARTGILEDPYVIKLRAQPTNPDASMKLNQVLSTGQTYCQDQLKKLCSKAEHIYEELGHWAADYFITAAIAKFRESVVARSELLRGWDDAEKDYLLRLLEQVEVRSSPGASSMVPTRISPKVEQLIGLLTEESNAEFSGLIFVKQRATVAVLCHLLSVHPKTSDRFECGTFIGTSTTVTRKTNLGELLDPKGQKSTLQEFRKGSKNLIIATSVLEEGIDISSCHLVICFSKPENVKSFIQRRGRARKEQSTLALMLAADDDSNSLSTWQALEEEMIRTYQDELRKLGGDADEMETVDSRRLEVDSTGALITLDNAMAHLYHFCAILPHKAYAELSPAFAFDQDAKTKLILATVTLPSSVDPSVRQTSGLKRWRTERAAKKDAAFEAYVRLRSVGLINDHLLPLWEDDRKDPRPATDVCSLVDVPEQYSPWRDVAECWTKSAPPFERVLSIRGAEGDPLRMRLYLPVEIPSTLSCALHWNLTTCFSVTDEHRLTVGETAPENFQVLRDVTSAIIQSGHSICLDDQQRDFPALFTPDIDVPGLEAWLARNTGVRPARGEADARAPASDEMGLVRDKLKSGEAYTFLRWIEGDDSNDGGTRMSAVEVLPLPKRRDFLHSDYEVTGQGSPVSPQVSSKRKAQVLSVDNCSFDNLPFKYTRFALFIPSILHLLEVSLVADRVRQQVIPSVDIRDCNLVITAICASSAREPSNYQKLELLGDSVLKFLATAQLFVEHVNWHEGYLSMGKECIVSNSRLARAARDRSLDRFIITKSFTGRKWSPSDLLVSSPDATRVMPSKVLADVVESLIGAAFVDGGLQKSAKCASVFLSELDGIPPDVKFASFSPTPELATESDMAELEDMIGYSFSNKGILREAMTHPSCENDSASLSYQRLEFLGDSLLDYVVVTTLHREYKGLPHTELHLAKTALVNASFLAYLCLELSALQHGVEVHQRGRTFDTVPTARATQLWGFMRHHNTEIVQAQQGCAGRHSQLREAIKSALTSGLSYPWVELTQLEAPKFFSDVVESLVGAIFVDSKGDLSACTRFVERIGMLRYLRRVGVDGPDLLHPKERLGHLAGNRTVAYKVGVEDGAAYWCAVEVAGIEIVRVGGGSSRVEAETRAAREASAMMLDGESRKRSWADN